MQCKFHHTALRVKNFDEVVKFYKDVFSMTEYISWVHQEPQESYPAIMLKMPGGGILEIFGGRADGAEANPLWIQLCFETDDVSAMYQKALDAGAKPHVKPSEFAIPCAKPVDVDFAFVYGLAGEVIEFLKIKS